MVISVDIWMWKNVILVPVLILLTILPRTLLLTEKKMLITATKIPLLNPSPLLSIMFVFLYTFHIMFVMYFNVGSAISATLVHTSSKFIGFEFITCQKLKSFICDKWNWAVEISNFLPFLVAILDVILNISKCSRMRTFLRLHLLEYYHIQYIPWSKTSRDFLFTTSRWKYDLLQPDYCYDNVRPNYQGNIHVVAEFTELWRSCVFTI